MIGFIIGLFVGAGAVFAIAALIVVVEEGQRSERKTPPSSEV